MIRIFTIALLFILLLTKNGIAQRWEVRTDYDLLITQPSPQQYHNFPLYNVRAIDTKYSSAAGFSECFHTGRFCFSVFEQAHFYSPDLSAYINFDTAYYNSFNQVISKQYNYLLDYCEKRTSLRTGIGAEADLFPHHEHFHLYVGARIGAEKEVYKKVLTDKGSLHYTYYSYPIYYTTDSSFAASTQINSINKIQAIISTGIRFAYNFSDCFGASFGVSYVNFPSALEFQDYAFNRNVIGLSVGISWFPKRSDQ